MSQSHRYFTVVCLFSNGTDHFGLVQPKYSGPALKVVHFDRSGHFGRSHRNVPFHLTKLLSPVPLFCILLTRTITKRVVAWVGSVQPECIVHCEISEMLNGKRPWHPNTKGEIWKQPFFMPRPHRLVFVSNLRWDFFSPVWPAVRTYLVKTVTKNASFQKLTPFTGFSFTCWRSKTEVFEFDDVTHHNY